MKMPASIQFAFAALFALFLTACNSASNQAQEAANNFWMAYASKDYDSAARMMIKPSTTNLRFSRAVLSPENVTIGEVRVQDQVAVAETIIGSGNDQRTILTVMQKANDQWLIDFEAMKSSWTRSVLNGVKSDLRDGVNWLDGQLDDAFESLDDVLTPIEEFEAR